MIRESIFLAPFSKVNFLRLALFKHSINFLYLLDLFDKCFSFKAIKKVDNFNKYY